MADTIYGVRLEITPDTSNHVKTYTVLYRADTTGGTKTELSRRFGTGVWTYDDTRPLNSGVKYYWIRAEATSMTPSSYVGPVDADATDLQVET